MFEFLKKSDIIPKSLIQTCRLETTSLCLNNGLRAKKFQIHIIFIKINVNVFHLRAHHVMTSIIFHTR